MLTEIIKQQRLGINRHIGLDSSSPIPDPGLQLRGGSRWIRAESLPPAPTSWLRSLYLDQQLPYYFNLCYFNMLAQGCVILHSDQRAPNARPPLQRASDEPEVQDPGSVQLEAQGRFRTASVSERSPATAEAQMNEQMSAAATCPWHLQTGKHNLDPTRGD